MEGTQNRWSSPWCQRPECKLPFYLPTPWCVQSPQYKRDHALLAIYDILLGSDWNINPTKRVGEHELYKDGITLERDELPQG